MFSLDKSEELIKIRLISSIWNNHFDSPKKRESLFLLSHPDIVVLDKNQQIALLVDVQTKKLQKRELKEKYLSQVTNLYLQNAKKAPRFAIHSNDFSKPEVRETLGNAGITYFTMTQQFLDWFNCRSSS